MMALDLDTARRIELAVDDMASQASETARNHGFHKAYLRMRELLDTGSAEGCELIEALDQMWYASRMMGIVSEATEAYDAVRKGEGPLHLAEELADVIIRAGDVAVQSGESLGRALVRKMTANEHRPYMHGRRAL